MSSQEVTSENALADAKQVTGSLKRKRKSSIIKHNVHNEKSQSNEIDGSAKQSKSNVKKIKTEKGKPAVDKSGSEEVEKNFVSECFDEKDDSSSEEVPIGDMGKEEEKKVEIPFVDDDLMCSEGGKTKCVLNAENEDCMEKQQQCQNCNFCAEHRQTTDDEIKVEYVSKMYTCKICAGFGLKRVYSSVENYKRHTKAVHEPKKDAKRFECTDCPEPMWFPTKSKYCYHLGAKHPGVIKFVCDVCTQTFKLKANYKNHLKTHNVVVQKKFSCDICGGTFVNKAGYEAHKKRFPGPHIKQSCARCGVSFSKEKHMKNHRCKILLLEEAEAAAAAAASRDSKILEVDNNAKGVEQDQIRKECEGKQDLNNLDLGEKKLMKDGTSDVELDGSVKKQSAEGEGAGAKRVLLHRLLPKKNEKLIYKQFPLPAQNVPQSVVVQEYREIDLEGSAFITAEPDHPIIVRDVNGQLVQGNQILQLDINDFQSGEESQVYLADWNIVAPFVLRGKSP